MAGKNPFRNRNRNSKGLNHWRQIQLNDAPAESSLPKLIAAFQAEKCSRQQPTWSGRR